MQHNISLDTLRAVNKMKKWQFKYLLYFIHPSITMHPTETHTHKHNHTIVNNFIIEDCPEDLGKKRSNRQKENTQ